MIHEVMVELGCGNDASYSSVKRGQLRERERRGLVQWCVWAGGSHEGVGQPQYFLQFVFLEQLELD